MLQSQILQRFTAPQLPLIQLIILQISLLDASKCVMVKNLQAHIGNITCMETGTDIGETGFKLMETSRKLATGGADGVIRVWELSVNEGILYDNIVFQMMVKVG